MKAPNDIQCVVIKVKADETTKKAILMLRENLKKETKHDISLLKKHGYITS